MYQWFNIMAVYYGLTFTSTSLSGPTQLDMEPNLEERALGLLDIFRPREILYRSVNMMYQWFSVTMCFYGLTFASTSLSGDAYRNFILTCLIEIPGCLFCIFTMDCWGRRRVLSFCQLISGICCICAGLMVGVTALGPLQVLLSLIGKLMASASFVIVYIYTAELFPTLIRNRAIGSCSAIASVGGITALLLNLIKEHWTSGPMVVMGIVAIMAGGLATLFPETVGQKLPHTMADAINMGKNNKRGLCTCVCPKNLKSYFSED